MNDQLHALQKAQTYLKEQGFEDPQYHKGTPQDILIGQPFELSYKNSNTSNPIYFAETVKQFLQYAKLGFEVSTQQGKIHIYHPGNSQNQPSPIHKTDNFYLAQTTEGCSLFTESPIIPLTPDTIHQLEELLHIAREQIAKTPKTLIINPASDYHNIQDAYHTLTGQTIPKDKIKKFFDKHFDQSMKPASGRLGFCGVHLAWTRGTNGKLILTTRLPKLYLQIGQPSHKHLDTPVPVTKILHQPTNSVVAYINGPNHAYKLAQQLNDTDQQPHYNVHNLSLQETYDFTKSLDQLHTILLNNQIIGHIDPNSDFTLKILVA